MPYPLGHEDIHIYLSLTFVQLYVIICNYIYPQHHYNSCTTQSIQYHLYISYISIPNTTYRTSMHYIVSFTFHTKSCTYLLLIDVWEREREIITNCNSDIYVRDHEESIVCNYRFRLSIFVYVHLSCSVLVCAISSMVWRFHMKDNVYKAKVNGQ